VPAEERVSPVGSVSGEVRLHRVGAADGWTPLGGFFPNAVLYDWGAVVAALLARKGLNYAVGGMYVEFENVAAGSAAVTPPPFGRGPGEGVAYYNALADSPDRDYLRVPLVAAAVDTTDPVRYPGGNRVTFFAQTAGLAGVHGRPFTEAARSTVFGAALAAFVDPADPTRDVVFSRFYLPASGQQPKTSGGQVGIEWRLTFL